MKILAVHSAILPDAPKQSQVDHWRIYRPMQELAKHTGWEIEHSPTFIPKFDKYKDKSEFTEEEFQQAYMNLAEYDIIFSSYHADASAFTLLQVLARRAGVQYVMDVDDDVFGINPDNPFWLKMTDDKVYHMQRMIAHNPWIITPSEHLAERFRDRRPGLPKDSVTVIPNYIADVYQAPPFDNGDELVIGYMGGASHYADLHDSGCLEAIQKLMHENKHIRFKIVGMIVDTYLPRGRVTREDGMRGTDFFDKVFPTLAMDISIAPLLPNIFNNGKSNIKWQEMTRAGAVTVASDFGPYKGLKDGVNALLVKQNTPEGWYKALKMLIERPALRKLLLENAQKDVKLNWRLENEGNWQKYQALFQRILKSKEKTNADHRTFQGLSAGQTQQTANKN